MGAKTWFGTNTVLSTLSQEMSETSPGADATSSPNVGWTVGTGSTNAADMDAGTKVASSAFTGTGPPDGSLVTGTGSNGDHFRSTNKYTGSFASGNWVWHGVVIGVTNSGAQDGRIDVRLFRGPNADGTGATEITAGKQTGSTITNLSTTQQDSTVTFNPGAFSVTDEYIFIQVAWVRTGAGGMSTTDVVFRYGTTATRLISADFTETRTITASADAVVQQAGRTITASGDGVVQSTRSITASSDAVVQSTRTITAGADAHVEAGGGGFTATITANANAVVQSTQTVTASASAVVQDRRTITSSANAVVQSTQAITASVDATVQSSRSLNTSASAVVRATQMIAAAADAYVHVIPRVTALADAVVALSRAVTCGADAFVDRLITVEIRGEGEIAYCPWWVPGWAHPHR